MTPVELETPTLVAFDTPVVAAELTPEALPALAPSKTPLPRELEDPDDAPPPMPGTPPQSNWDWSVLPQTPMLRWKPRKNWYCSRLPSVGT